MFPDEIIEQLSAMGLCTFLADLSVLSYHFERRSSIIVCVEWDR